MRVKVATSGLFKLPGTFRHKETGRVISDPSISGDGQIVCSDPAALWAWEGLYSAFIKQFDRIDEGIKHGEG